MTHILKNTAATALFRLLLTLAVLGGGWGSSLLAQSVQVKTLSTDYASKKVTFSISWAAGTRDDTHLSKIWVFVDFATVITDNQLGAWQRAEISSATTTAGTISGHTGQGFFLEGSTGAFSATVTATLSNMPPMFSWCAFATDYPPVATLKGGVFELSGTLPFIINGNISEPSFTYTGGGITLLTDKTGCPGTIIAEPTVSTTSPDPVCAGSAVTLTATASGGTTTAMIYTWNIGGTETTTTVNSYTVPATSVTIGMTYSVTVANAYGHTSQPASGSITVDACGGSGSGNGESISRCSTVNLSFTSGFGSTDTCVVGSQTWSAPVTATYCRKTSFYGGGSGAYNSDCRANNGSATAVNVTYGDLFSWCMVVKFKETICPSGWRVPTKEDFCTLDKALNNRSDCSAIYDATSRNRYLNTWGGQSSGSAYNGSLYTQGAGGRYWSQSEYNSDFGYGLGYNSDDGVSPQNYDYKNYGFTLRCIK